MSKDRYIFRQIRETDFKPFSRLVEQIPIGMGTKYKYGSKMLYQLICKSERDFKQNVQKPNGEAYIFVVEYDNKLIGTISVYANHRQSKFWSYRICDQNKVMTLSTYFSGCSSFGCHFVDKNYRKTPAALILVRRVVEYINHTPHRFTSTIISESRGVYDSKKKINFGRM